MTRNKSGRKPKATTKKKPTPKTRKRKRKPSKRQRKQQSGVAPGIQSGYLRTPEEIEAAYRQMGLYRDNIAVERSWLGVESSRESLRRDGLLGISMDKLQGDYELVLTEALVIKLATYVRDGNSLNVAARSAAVPINLLRTWIREGLKTPNSPCGRLVVRLDQAAALAEANAISRLYNGKAGWRSSLQYLNHVKDMKYNLRQSDILESESETQQHQESVKENTPIDIDRAALVMALIESAAGPGKPDADDDVPDNVVEIIKSA